METVSANGVPLSFEDTGKGAPPILLIRDLERDLDSWQSQFELFRARHRVVVVDLESGNIGKPSQAYTPADLADALAWLCSELGVYRPVAVGQSVSGAVAVEVAARYPDLLAAVVTLDASTPIHANCEVPVLLVETSGDQIDLDLLRNSRPGIFVESVRLRHLHQDDAAKRINIVIEAFLVRYAKRRESMA